MARISLAENASLVGIAPSQTLDPSTNARDDKAKSRSLVATLLGMTPSKRYAPVGHCGKV
jgi:hypothetical protein